jgi:transketolase
MPATLGMAMARNILNEKGQLYVLVGDGESQEGTTWESMLLAKRFNVGNLTVIVDMNGIQGSGYVDEILPVTALGDTARAIGWNVQEVNGHNISEVTNSLRDTGGNDPKMIICHTIKGKGVPYMEDVPAWHAQWVDDEKEAGIRELLT